ncbi:hypothetical protein KQX54_016123 [Cotesia glomerata]|uniref:Apple domain-containing protein n=1 Tax=Cotesia glomerata TaxID=32391 RepID=A0AAV7ITS7_COTGL|nr:hypothetical protein KQX54_016123 [Cotesia glomerata]
MTTHHWRTILATVVQVWALLALGETASSQIPLSSTPPAVSEPSGVSGPDYTGPSAGSDECDSEMVGFELVTGYVYTAPTNMLESIPGILMLTDCLETCQANDSCQAVNYETGLCVLFSSNADNNPGDKKFSFNTRYAACNRNKDNFKLDCCPGKNTSGLLGKLEIKRRALRESHSSFASSTNQRKRPSEFKLGTIVMDLVVFDGNELSRSRNFCRTRYSLPRTDRITERRPNSPTERTAQISFLCVTCISIESPTS